MAELGSAPAKAPRRRRLALRALSLVLLLTTGGGFARAEASEPTPRDTPLVGVSANGGSQSSQTTGYVTAAGSKLMVGSVPWKMAGYNLPCSNSTALEQSGGLGYYLDDIKQNSGANVIRVWFYQSLGGPGNWTTFDGIISALKSRGMRAIVTLANGTGTCDEPSPPTPYKPLTWYQTGFMYPYGGYPLSFRAYATDVAQHYAREPAVAFYQLINEPSAVSYTSSGSTTCNEPAAKFALRRFSDNVISSMAAADPNHLVDVGSLNIGQCGMGNDTDYTWVHGGRVALCEYHDYGAPAQAMPAGLSSIVNDCSTLAKPVYIGEAGIPASVDASGNPASSCSPWPDCSPNPVTIGSLNQRAQFFQAKIDAANAAGLAGYTIWEKSPYYNTSTDAYSVPDGDPTEAVLPSALKAYP